MAKTKERDLAEQELDIALTFPDEFKSRRKLTDAQFIAHVDKLQNQIQLSKQGKRSRDKGSSYERKVAKLFNEAYGTVLVRTPLSGGFHKSKDSDMKGDLINLDPSTVFRLHLECKNHRVWRLKDWILQAQEEARGKIPIIIAHQHQETGDKPIKANDFVILQLSDFLNLVEQDKVVTNRERASDTKKRKLCKR
jgi:hypothetical protein